MHFETVAVSIFDQGCRGIKAHWLVVEQSHIKLSGSMHLQPGTSVTDQRKTDRVRFWKSVQGKRGDGGEDFFCYFVVYVICSERITQLLFDALHSFLRTMITECSPQFFRFISRKVGHDHCDFQHLLLKKRHTKRAFQNRNESRIEVGNFLEPLAPGQIRMHEMTLNRPRSNDGDFDQQIVKSSQ